MPVIAVFATRTTAAPIAATATTAAMARLRVLASPVAFSGRDDLSDPLDP
jgi:hypothetical protein